MNILQKIGQKLAHYLSKPRKDFKQVATNSPQELTQSLRPGDVLLVEGNSSFSAAIKYLTQSSWSHTALFVGDALPSVEKGIEQPVLVEADINDGVRSVGLSLYTPFHTRICRPVGLNKDEINQVINYVVGRMGHTYDLRNIIDLAKYLFPMPPIPIRARRRILSLGSTDATQAICSSLIAQAFQSNIQSFQKLLYMSQTTHHVRTVIKKCTISDITACSLQETLMSHHISEL